MSSKKPLSYKDYLRLDELLKLQTLQSRPRQHDEVLFIIAHQAYELWFKLMLSELESALSSMLSDDPEEATRLIGRVVAVQRVLIQQLEVLETIRPVDFLKFRNLLQPASGFQSIQFRELEFISGLKDERHLKSHANDEDSYDQLLRRWEGPVLWDGFRAVLEKRGLDVGPDTDEPSEKEKAVIFEKEVRAVTRVFTDPEYVHVAELAEMLMEYDKHFRLWRTHHVTMVERIIGRREGTGASVVKKAIGTYSFDSSGVAYLETTLDKRFFPVLWAARTRIGEEN